MSNLPKLRRNASTSSDMSSLASQGPSTNTGYKMLFLHTQSQQSHMTKAMSLNKILTFSCSAFMSWLRNYVSIKFDLFFLEGKITSLITLSYVYGVYLNTTFCLQLLTCMACQLVSVLLICDLQGRLSWSYQGCKAQINQWQFIFVILSMHLLSFIALYISIYNNEG